MTKHVLPPLFLNGFNKKKLSDINVFHVFQCNHPQNVLMDMNIIIPKKKCLNDPNRYKQSKITFFDYALTQKSIGTVFATYTSVFES